MDSILVASFRNLLTRNPCTLLLFGLLFTAPAGRAQLTWGDWRYSINGNNAIVTKYTGWDSDVAIPGTINGLPVQFIDIAAFAGNTILTNVFIPSSVAGILNGAAAVPFDSCPNLLSINVDSTSPWFSSIDGVFFNKKQTSILEYPNGRPGSYSIPAGVLRVAPYAFDSCTNLTSVTIPNTVTNIMSHSFHGCSALMSVTIPAGVQTIGDFAFTGSDYLTNIFFLGNAPAAGLLVFAPSWVALPKVIYYIPSTTGWGATYAGYQTAPLALSVTTPNVNNGQFSFSVAGPTGISLVIEYAPRVDSDTWSPIQTGILGGGALLISDPDWINYPTRFYRVRLN